MSTPLFTYVENKEMEQTEEIHWNQQLEEILSQEGERALCYAWLHNKSQTMVSKYDTNIALPVIVLSTIAGTGSIASQSLFGQSQTASVVIGVISLSVGIMNTVSNYFGFAKRSEAHKISSMTYAKIHKFIVIELSLPRKERMKAKDMLKIIREQLERLAETSPQIPDPIIAMFNEKFHDQKNVSKPEITNGLDPIRVYVENSEAFTPDSKSNIEVKLFHPTTGAQITPEPLRPGGATVAGTPVVPKISIPGRTPGT
jgi:hypothetical protein